MATDVGTGVPPEALRYRDAKGSYIVAAVLLFATFVGLLWVPSYAHVTPTLGGIPFFYWYSLLWLVVNAVCQIIAYQLLVGRRRHPGVTR
jgi:uncharacterized RDD family membrane protein YckC